MNVHIVQDEATGVILAAYAGDSRGADLANADYASREGTAIYLLKVIGVDGGRD